MKLNTFSLVLALLMAASPLCFSQVNRGFYKDIFQDSGIMLTSRRDLPASRSLGLRMESFISAQHLSGKPYPFTATDTLLQRQMISGNEGDENGVLLYPDGAPRFRMIYVNGGKAASHGASLGEDGKNAIRAFVKAGGSYLGSCAGAFLASTASRPRDKDTLTYAHRYLGVWPGYVTGTKLEKSWTDIQVVDGSPLLRYYDFGAEHRVDSVRHNGGCFANTSFCYPEKTEILALFTNAGQELKYSIEGMPSIWAFKEGPATGRVVLCGSHPEEVVEGERLQLMNAMVLYALDGVGQPSVKGELVPGEPRKMDRSTHHNAPAFTKIGDKQYHHFTLEIPRGTKKVTLSLSKIKNGDYDLYLFANPSSFAFMGEARYENIRLGVDKSLEIENPEAGTMYVSVFCDTTVDAVQTAYGTQYSGRTDVLNGVPYVIKAEF